jgi:hypothetical protein
VTGAAAASIDHPTAARSKPPRVNTANPYRPVCPALLFAERVDVDVARKRIDIHNLMNGAVATAFPAPLSFWIHFSLTGGQGTYRMKLILEHDQSGELLALWEGAASLRTPIVMHEQPVQVSVVVHQVGHYWVKLYADDEPIAQRAFPILIKVGGS